MYQSPLTQQIIAIVEPSLEAMGYRLVRIHWQDGGRRTLQIMAERLDEAEITVEDCTEISHMVSALLDVEDPISGAYDLEVSSPGVDRPLVSARDFTDYAGYVAKIEMHLPVEGRKRFKGTLKGIDTNETVTIEVDSRDWLLPLKDMHSAKLVMTDALLKEPAGRRKRTELTD